MCELLHLVGGTILPSETFSQDCAKAGKILLGGEKNRSTESPLSSWISILPPDATLNCLLYNSPAYEASFPRTEGTLFLPLEGNQILFWEGRFMVSGMLISSRQVHAFHFFRVSHSLGTQWMLIIKMSVQDQVPQESVKHRHRITTSPPIKRTSKWFLKNFPAIAKKVILFRCLSKGVARFPAS